MMKTLYMIGGTMGVGKTTVCQQLKQESPPVSARYKSKNIHYKVMYNRDKLTKIL